MMMVVILQRLGKSKTFILTVTTLINVCTGISKLQQQFAGSILRVVCFTLRPTKPSSLPLPLYCERR